MTKQDLSLGPKAYSYIRMSTDVQRKGDSHRRQLELSKNYATEHGLNLVETLEDVGVSAFKGKNARDGALGRFILALDEGKIEAGSYLLVESLDRISRDSIFKAFGLLSTILEHQIVLVTLADRQVYREATTEKDAGQLFMTLGVMLRANEESRTKSERLSAAWGNKRKHLKERKLTSLCPSWLKFDPKYGRFILIPQRAGSVQEIFRLAIEGYGSGAICQMFNDAPDRYPPTDGAKGWHKSYIQKILASPAVYGQFQPHRYSGRLREPDGPPIDDYFPAVISIDDFNLAQARVAQRRINGARRKGENFANIFTRIAHCSACGSVISFKNAGDGPKGGKYLRCAKASRNLRCEQPSWEYEHFERSFLKFVSEIDMTDLTRDDLTATDLTKATNHLSVIEKKLADLNAEYINTLKLAARATESVSVDLLNIAEKVKLQIDQNESARRLQKSLIAGFSTPTALLALGENIQVYIKALDGKGAVEVGALRHKIYNAIRHLVSDILFRNYDTFLPGDEFGLVEPSFLKMLAKRRYKTPEHQERYMLTPAGQKFYGDYLRSYIVVFKNGNKRLIQPARGLVINFLDPFRILPHSSSAISAMTEE